MRISPVTNVKSTPAECVEAQKRALEARLEAQEERLSEVMQEAAVHKSEVEEAKNAIAKLDIWLAEHASN